MFNMRTPPKAGSYRMPVSNWSCTVVVPLDSTATFFACDLGEMMGASGPGTTRYVPPANRTSKWPSESERNEATTRFPRSTVKLALNGASHGTPIWQTGRTGPRTTVPTSAVLLGAVGAPQPAVQHDSANAKAPKPSVRDITLARRSVRNLEALI
jgi:hypothetical protein